MSVVTLAEAKTHLNITASTSDAELQTFLDRAEAAVTSKCGPLAATATTSRVSGEAPTLALPVAPVISLTSVTPVGGSALTVGDYLVTSGGNVEAISGAWFSSRWYDVVYSAGRASLPADLKYGVLELVRHFWDSQRRGRGPAEQMQPVAGYAFPNRVQQLIEPFLMATL